MFYTSIPWKALYAFPSFSFHSFIYVCGMSDFTAGGFMINVTYRLYCFQNAVGWRLVILFKISEFTIPFFFVLPLGSSLLSLKGSCQGFTWLFHTSHSPSSTPQGLQGYDYWEDLLLAVTQSCGWGNLWFKEIIRLCCCCCWIYQEETDRRRGQTCPRREKWESQEQHRREGKEKGHVGLQGTKSLFEPTCLEPAHKSPATISR